MNVRCHHCSTVYRVDPQKIPAGGIHARCAACGGVFPVARQEARVESGVSVPSVDQAATPAGVGSPPTATASQGATAAAPAPPAPVTPFGASDPHARARRLARALISDIAVYHPERRDRSLQNNTLRQEFREEIRKSWDEFVEQVGEEIARNTPYFRDALNEILARGQRIF